MVDAAAEEREFFLGEPEGTGEEPEGLVPEEGNELLTPSASRERWQSHRPNVDHLRPGLLEDPSTGTGLPVFDVGDRLVVDVRTALLSGSPWLHTVVGRVLSIDDDTGVVSLEDESSDPRAPTVRHVSMCDGLHDFRVPPPKGDPFNVVLVRAYERAQKAAEFGAPRKGRPAGSKNRPKEVIRAEREAYAKMREEKLARKAAGQ